MKIENPQFIALQKEIKILGSGDAKMALCMHKLKGIIVRMNLVEELRSDAAVGQAAYDTASDHCGKLAMFLNKIRYVQKADGPEKAEEALGEVKGAIVAAEAVIKAINAAHDKLHDLIK